MVTCINCNHNFEGSFCNNCGQHAQTKKIKMHDILHDIQHGLFHFDNGIFFTIRQLITRPGFAIREFVEGKRVKYFKPFAFAVVMATVYGLLFHQIANQLADIQPVSYADSLSETYLRIMRWIFDHFAISNLFLIVLTSISTYIVFRKSGYGFAEVLVLNTYYRGTILIFNMVAMLMRFILWNSDIGYSYEIGMQLVDFLFMYWCYKQFFNLSWAKGLWLSTLTFLLNSVLVVTIGYLVFRVVELFK
jgi:hypothetical protein